MTLLVIVISLWTGHTVFGGFDETLPDALAAGRVQVKVTLQQNATESKAGERRHYSAVQVRSGASTSERQIDPGQALVLIDVRRTGGWRRGELTLTIPAGTTLTSGYDGYQRLATAYAVTVQLRKADEAETAWVPVYCLDQHRPAPTLNTGISLEHKNLDDSRNVPSELGRLASCLAEKGLPGVDRQQAVWLVAEGHLRRSREELRTYLHEKNLAILKRMDLDEMQSKVLALVRLAHPDASEDDQRSEARLYMQDRAWSLIERKAAERAERDLDRLLSLGRPALRTCGYDLSAVRLGDS
ncbi:hypothetical protein [Ramlibacter sp. AN1133]|uniref:hypothetical protein n=1 Tax=Ramlibacter sp. AN1133 TaxID=3133429 RepID=UPI0030BC32BC